MQSELQAIYDGWANLTTAQLGSALPRQLDIDEIPALPLAKALDMPPQAGFARGDLGIKLGRLRVAPSGEQPLRIELAGVEPDRGTVELRVSGLRLSGTQEVQGTQIWESGIDGAGTGLRHGVRMRGGADDDNDPHPTWIATANKQREALQNVAGGNGAALLSTYSTHRAAFTDAFTSQYTMSFQNGWAAGPISDMAQDTNDSVNNNGVINSSSKTYGTTTYNGNAQTQQLALAIALTTLAALDNPNNPKDPNNPHNLAAASVATFASSIMQNTNVGQLTDVPEHNSDQVFAIVAKGKPAPAVSVEDVHTLLNGNPIGGRDAEGNAWTMVLSEDERAFVRRMQAEHAEHIARLNAIHPVPLAQGGLRATLDCFVALRFAHEGGLRLLDGRVELDGFDLDFDDSGWDAALGTGLAHLAREALGQARFIKSLLHDRVADTLERALVPALAGVLLGAR
ncbi:hypothetical protein LMG19083_04759 [Ralstonia psammae]|uniref:Uncharacterized protein n=1 Tax=Ralstonia psammae TaxID=3058598 RepID=A0ABN9JDZ7_9RALS|nr:hypothetical protein [Ralstonia sp. LMG 19083]CAJ0808718.1 hypothetical protein LMG19083_04759 [Ralstonia sp. LMG 19083]